MRNEGNRAKVLAEYQAAAAQTEALERQVGKGFFEDGKEFAHLGVQGREGWIGVFKFPEKRSVLFAVHNETRESVIVGLASESALPGGEKVTNVSFAKVNASGRFVAVDSGAYLMDLNNWIRHQVKRKKISLAEDRPVTHRTLIELNRPQPKSESDPQGPLPGSAAGSTASSAARSHVEPSVESILKTHAQSIRIFTAKTAPDPKYVEALGRLIDVIDPERDNITGDYLVKKE